MHLPAVTGGSALKIPPQRLSRCGEEGSRVVQRASEAPLNESMSQRDQLAIPNQPRHPSRGTSDSQRMEMTDDIGQFAPDDQQEDINDLDAEGSWFEDAVLWSADWTAETIISQLRRGNINLNPVFQRRSAWNQERKSLFIESLILGLPIPQIILAEDRMNKGRFIVIDGKQRLLAIRQFAAQQDDEFDKLILKGLDDRKDLNGRSYEELRGDIEFRKDIDRFENQTIRTVVIRGWSKENYLYSVFLRINQGSVTLSPQELRQALHPGKFSLFVDATSANSKRLREALGLSEPDFRMRDAELLLRFFAYKNFASAYSGNLKAFLDAAHIYFNRNWSKSEVSLNNQLEELEKALDFLKIGFGRDAYLRKWNGKNFETRINRAVFDVMTYYFSEPDIRAKTIDSISAIKSEFMKLCETREFLSSIETTTKSKEANHIRFGEFASLLRKYVGDSVRSPFE